MANGWTTINGRTQFKFECDNENTPLAFIDMLDTSFLKRKERDEIKKAAECILEATGKDSPPICLYSDQRMQLHDVLLNKKERKKIMANPFPMAAYIQIVKIKCQNCLDEKCEDRDPNFPLEK